MSDRKEEIDILDVDRTRDGIIVTFTNGASALFRPHFLFEMREHDGNVQLEKNAGRSNAGGYS